MSREFWCNIFVTDAELPDQGYSVQVQVTAFTITCKARDLEFVEAICNFVSETRANPQYRDISLGNGRYEVMPPKLIDVSSSFVDVSVTFHKSGEFDDRYIVRVQQGTSLSLIMVLHGISLDAFLEELASI
jgi:hypothetical protein